MFLGLVLGLFLCNADKIIREDGSKVVLMKNPSWKTELMGLWETLRAEPWIVALFPMFFSSNIFYTYQNNGLNGAHFNVRTRALNGLLYWLAQIIGAIIMGYCLDVGKISRSLRAKICWAVIFAITFVVWGGGYAWEIKQVSRKEASTKEYQASSLVDWTDGGEKFIGPMFLYFFYGFFDAVWQTSIYWFMGSLSNSGRKAANLAGFYKVRIYSFDVMCQKIVVLTWRGNRESKVLVPALSGQSTVMITSSTAPCSTSPGLCSHSPSSAPPPSSSGRSRTPSHWRRISSSATRLPRMSLSRAQLLLRPLVSQRSVARFR